MVQEVLEELATCFRAFLRVKLHAPDVLLAHGRNDRSAIIGEGQRAVHRLGNKGKTVYEIEVRVLGNSCEQGVVPNVRNLIPANMRDPKSAANRIQAFDSAVDQAQAVSRV